MPESTDDHSQVQGSPPPLAALPLSLSLSRSPSPSRSYALTLSEEARENRASDVHGTGADFRDTVVPALFWGSPSPVQGVVLWPRRCTSGKAVKRSHQGNQESLQVRVLPPPYIMAG